MKKAFKRSYLFEKPRWAYTVALIDSIGYFLIKRNGEHLPRDIKKILVSRIDHLGDVFIAGSILPPLKEAFPGAEIHFLAGRWAGELLESNPYIKKTLFYNSFRHNRSGGFFKRFFDASKSFFSALLEIRRERYDLAIDLRAYFFNSLPLLGLSGIKYLVGFPTGGFGFLLHREIPYRKGVHETEHIRDALRELGIDGDPKVPAIEPSPSDEREAERIFKDLKIAPKERFALLHTGSGNPKKLWKREGWEELIKGLSRIPGLRVVLFDEVYRTPFRDAVTIEKRPSIGTFAAIASRAEIFIGLDSFPAHLSASLGIPVVVLWCGINDPVQWRPLGGNVRVVKRELDCSPCRNANGCPGMECMDLNPGDILNEVRLGMEQRARARPTGTI